MPQIVDRFIEYTHWQKEDNGAITQVGRRAIFTSTQVEMGLNGYFDIYDLSNPPNLIQANARWIQYVANDGRLWFGYAGVISIYIRNNLTGAGYNFFGLGWRHCLGPVFNNENEANHLDPIIKLQQGERTTTVVFEDNSRRRTGQINFVYDYP